MIRGGLEGDKGGLSTSLTTSDERTKGGRGGYKRGAAENRIGEYINESGLSYLRFLGMWSPSPQHVCSAGDRQRSTAGLKLNSVESYNGERAAVGRRAGDRRAVSCLIQKKVGWISCGIWTRLGGYTFNTRVVPLTGEEIETFNAPRRRRARPWRMAWCVLPARPLAGGFWGGLVLRHWIYPC